MSTQYNFNIPLDKPYDPLNAVSLGVTLFNNVAKWNLDVRTGILKLSNDRGFEEAIGRLTKTAIRCSLTVMPSGIPYFVIEYNDETKALFSYNLVEQSLISHSVNLDHLRDVSIIYNKALCRSGLVVTGIGVDGIYRGTLINDVLVIKNINPLSDTSKLSIHRFGLDTLNRLVTEIAEST